MFRRILVASAGLLLALAVSVALLWGALLPPRLPVPPRTTFRIADVDLVNPGLGRRSHVDIEVADGVITAV